jgi:hypothetical protein
MNAATFSSRIVDAGVDWHTQIYFSPALGDPEKQRVLINSFIAYVDKEMKPAVRSKRPGLTFESETKYASINSKHFLVQYRGWGFAKGGSNFLKESFWDRQRILKCFSANEIELSDYGDSRLDLQFTFKASADEVLGLAQLNAGSGSYRDYFVMSRGNRRFDGFTLYSGDYRIRCYNKSREVLRDEKKSAWLKEKVPDGSEVWRFEVQIERGIKERYTPLIEEFLAKEFVFDSEESKSAYLELTRSLFSIFNKRLGIDIIKLFIGNSEARDAVGNSAQRDGF